MGGVQLPTYMRGQVPARCVPQLQLECLATGAPSALLCSRSATKVQHLLDSYYASFLKSTGNQEPGLKTAQLLRLLFMVVPQIDGCGVKFWKSSLHGCWA